MGQKITGLILILAVMAVSGIGGFLVAGTQPVKAPAEHQAIVDVTIIRDTTYSFPLVPKCVDSGKKVWGLPIIGLAVFEEGEIYQQSTWIWQRNGDTEMAMTVWGPGEDQSTCFVELARLGTNTFEVKVKGEVEITMPSISGNYNVKPGYYSFTVEVE